MNKQDTYTLDIMQYLQGGPRTYKALQKAGYPARGGHSRHPSMIDKALHLLARHDLIAVKAPKGYTLENYRKARLAFTRALSCVSICKEPKEITTCPPPCLYCLTPLGKLLVGNFR